MPEDREPNAPDMPHADTRTPLHGPTGGVPSDKALSDTFAVTETAHTMLSACPSSEQETQTLPDRLATSQAKTRGQGKYRPHCPRRYASLKVAIGNQQTSGPLSTGLRWRDNCRPRPAQPVAPPPPRRPPQGCRRRCVGSTRRLSGWTGARPWAEGGVRLVPGAGAGVRRGLHGGRNDWSVETCRPLLYSNSTIGERRSLHSNSTHGFRRERRGAADGRRRLELEGDLGVGQRGACHLQAQPVGLHVLVKVVGHAEQFGRVGRGVRKAILLIRGREVHRARRLVLFPQRLLHEVVDVGVRVVRRRRGRGVLFPVAVVGREGGQADRDILGILRENPPHTLACSPGGQRGPWVHAWLSGWRHQERPDSVPPHLLRGRPPLPPSQSGATRASARC
eukprot:scaffold602_cov121-Isochrysis_galbana.AAC.4